jgi:hypothetical protein
MVTSTYIFNQYYIDLLKKIKTVSKKHKDKSTTARKVLKTIKHNYMTLDKSSDEYIKFINENITEEEWSKYIELKIEDNQIDEWLKENGDKSIFIDVSLDDIVRILRDKYLCHHYCSVFYVFKQDITEEQSENIVKILQTINNKELIDNIENENIKKVVLRLEELRNKTIKDKAGIDMNSIEDTTLGKLAKEILEDIDISKLKSSIGEDGDILKAISSPDSGFGELLSNVSKKMATKISSGELKQENLLQDAMKFASLMPGMFGANPNGDSKGGPPDMSNIMNMMSTMMGSGGGNSFENMFKNMTGAAGGGKNKKDTKTSFDNNKIRKMAKMKQMRDKLHKRRAQENDSNELNDD